MSLKKLFLLTIIIPLLVTAQEIPPRPEPPRLVNDLANVLSKDQEKYLEQKLRKFNDTTSNQIVILTVKSLNGYDKADYAFRVGEKWGVGQKKFDNGIVILIKPKYGERDRGQAFIAVGYGLEPAIPDVIARRIVSHEMIPYFKQNNYFVGLNKATDVLMKLASGEISSKAYAKQTEESKWVALIPFIILLLIFLLIRISDSKSYSISKKGSTSLWTAFIIGNMMGGGRSGSGFGSSGFGGGGFGGFGGFGGGSCGGGGAGGSW